MSQNNDNTLHITNKTSLISALTNAALALLKIFIGIVGYSYALVTDGIHSLSDLITDGLVVISARFGQKAADDDHPYGHRRIETFGTIIISLVIIAVGLGVVLQNIVRLVHHLIIPKPTMAVFAVAAISIIANEALYQYMIRQSRKIGSQLLASNAWHNRSDALTSAIVLISAGLSWFGLHYVDAIAAIIIAFFITRMGCKMIWQCVKELVDTAVSPELLEQIQNTISNVPGVVSLHQIRTRLHSGKILLDGHIQVNPYLSVSEGHYLCESVYRAIKEKIPEVVDATIHIDVEDDNETYTLAHPPLTSRETIKRRLMECGDELIGNKQIKSLQLHYLNHKIEVELLLPISLLEKMSENDILLCYRTCLGTIPDIELVTINYFRD